MVRRLWPRIRAQGPVWLAGFIPIAAGIICLYLSDQVATGWWQGTLDAFGVGFLIAGLADVLAISALNQAQRRRENNNLEAVPFLEHRLVRLGDLGLQELVLAVQLRGHLQAHRLAWGR